MLEVILVIFSFIVLLFILRTIYLVRLTSKWRNNPKVNDVVAYENFDGTLTRALVTRVNGGEVGTVTYLGKSEVRQTFKVNELFPIKVVNVRRLKN